MASRQAGNRSYKAPSIVEAGSVLDLTLANDKSGLLDATYPVGTPLPANPQS